MNWAERQPESADAQVDQVVDGDLGGRSSGMRKVVWSGSGALASQPLKNEGSVVIVIVMRSGMSCV